MKKITLLLLCILFVSNYSKADERKFGYTYQSTIMNKGEKEIEISTTARVGKSENYYAALDHRMEIEVGLSKKLQTAFYLNFSNTTTTNVLGLRETNFDFHGFSTEWKYQVSNPYTNSLGFALYSELGLNSDDVELETKLIFDKKFGKTIIALNLTAEPEWELQNGPADKKLKLESSFGLSHAFTNNFSAGFEVRQPNIYVDGELAHSSLFGGPVLNYAEPTWYVNLTVLPQLTSLKKIEGAKLDLDEFEKLEVRLLLSFNL